MPRNALQNNPAGLLGQTEMRPTPRNALLGAIADALQAGKGFANKAQIPAAVPLLGGQGLGDVLLGQAPQELSEWSYGNAPMRINPNAGKTASYVPEMKRGRGQGVADALMLAQVPGGKNALLAGAGAMDTGAAKAIFMGAKSKTWNAQAAERAMALEKSGADPRAIWSETGTFKGPDGMWRQEIDDSLSLSPYPSSAHSVKPWETTVGAEFRHKPLFDAYPDQADITLYKNDHGGDWTPSRGVEKEVIGAQIEQAGNYNKSILLHELQHATQGREGFALGGSSVPWLQNSYDDYLRLAGEAEARAVQKRARMDAAQRRKTFPLDSYDVPVDQLIIKR